MSRDGLSRRRILQALAAGGIGTAAFQRALASQVLPSQEATNDGDEPQEQEETPPGTVTPQMIRDSEWIAGIELNEEQREEVARNVTQLLRDATTLRAVPTDADIVPATVFRPDFFFGPSAQPGKTVRAQVSRDISSRLDSDDAIAMASIVDQAALLAAGKLTSRKLTSIYLERLVRYDPVLKLIVTLLEDEALASADASDARRSAGKSLGVLDGIPWVAKDLIAVPPHKTTWGAEPFRDQVRTDAATVATRLEEAGAVLLAKVSLGAMAWGDKWFGGTTRNPWNVKQGSSGSSAGSAAAVAAGLAAFALGSETLGSIVSPTRRCRTSGLRPTFGSVSRFGCMPLAWSMDKIGPIARHVDDLAIVFAAIMGPDGKDPTLVDRGFEWPRESPINSLRVGVTGGRMSATEALALEHLKSLGCDVVDVALPSELPHRAMSFILGVEASTVFEDSYRAAPNADYGLWPSTFRETPYVSAIQYLRANRMRSQLIRQTQDVLASVDVLLAADDLLLTNLTGHPSLVVACGSEESQGKQLPGVVKLTAAAYREDVLLQVGEVLQRGLPSQPLMPPLDSALEALLESEAKPTSGD